MVDRLAADRRGLGHSKPLDQGEKCRAPSLRHGSRVLSSDCRNQKANIRPIALHESCTKLVEASLCQHWDKAIRRALGRHQMGAESAADAQLALECLRTVARHEDTAEMCSTDIATLPTPFGTLHQERESPWSTGN